MKLRTALIAAVVVLGWALSSCDFDGAFREYCSESGQCPADAGAADAGG